MTNEEALSKVYEYIGRLKSIVPKSEQQEKSKTENMEFAVAVGTALEYRVEQKPIIRPYTNRRNSYKGYFCPRCDESIGTVGIPLDLDTVRFCGDCGQALLWDMQWEEELT